MVGMEADEQLAGFGQFVVVDQVDDGRHIGEIGMQGLEAAGIGEQFALRIQAMLAEVLVARDQP